MTGVSCMVNITDKELEALRRLERSDPSWALVKAWLNRCKVQTYSVLASAQGDAQMRQAQGQVQALEAILKACETAAQ